MPLPTTTLTTSATSFTQKTTTSYARDAGNTATIITSAAHGLRTGNIVTISDFTTTTGKTFNATNVEVTVINSTTFTYYNPGASVATTSDSAGRVSLAGNTQTRTYVYTWYTPWDEESIASEPSTALYIKEGQTVTVTGLPTATPSANYFVGGVRLYRTLPSTSGTDYYLGYMLIGTSKGVRVAAVSDDGSISYGPLLFESEQPVYDFAARDRFVWCATNVDGAPGTTRIDLGTSLGTLIFPYAWDTYYFPQTVGSRITGRYTTACAFINGTDRLAFCVGFRPSC